MKKHCKIIAVVGGILGILGTLFQSWQVVRYSMLLALLVLAMGGVVTYVIYIMWSSLAEILERLERLEGKASGGTHREPDFTKGEWKCTHCGSVNEEWQDTCGCGRDRYGKTHRKLRRQRGEPGKETDEETEVDTTDWQAGFICLRCGKVNQEGAVFCKRCGMPMQ